jgi:hypothetical membrane protein
VACRLREAAIRSTKAACFHVTRIFSRLGLWCGIAAPPLWLSVIFVAGALRPNYRHISQYISELAERGSVTATLMRDLGFYATGLMHLGFAGCLALAFAGRGMALAGALLIAIDGVGRIGAGYFPCDPGCAPSLPTASQELHGVFSRIGFLSMTAAPIVWGLVARRGTVLAPIRAYSILSGCLAAAALVAVVSGPRPLVGLYELLASATLSIWLLVFALRIRQLRGQPS